MTIHRNICLVLIFLAVSCHNKENSPLYTHKDNISAGQHITTVEGNNDFYAFAMPKQHKTNLPLFVLIDPHGNGRLAIDKFRPALQDYRFVVIGLNNVRNNTPHYDILIKKAVSKAINELPADQECIFYCGFSGGARMAFQYALTNDCKGVMMCGAGPQNNIADKIKFPLVNVSGLKDFNFIEQYYPPDSYLALRPDFISFYFKGKHEWPPPDIIKESISFLMLKSGLQKNIAEKNIKTVLDKIDSLLSAQYYMQAFKVLEEAYKTCNDKNQEILLSELRKMKNDQNIKTYFLSFENILRDEIARNQYYYRCLFTEDINWWMTDIAEIDGMSEVSSDSLIACSYSRTKAYLGVLLYSVTSSFVNNQQDKKLTEKLIAIYENLEPENPDVYYLKSLNALRQGDTASCLNYLKKSKKLGFCDFSLLKKDFPVGVYKKVFNGGTALE
jgi:tetratricopeptide (TPR) repeat protein